MRSIELMLNEGVNVKAKPPTSREEAIIEIVNNGPVDPLAVVTLAILRLERRAPYAECPDAHLVNHLRRTLPALQTHA